MSWATENKFIAGFGVVMAVGILGIGYLTYNASDALDAAQKSYSEKSNSLSNLHNQSPFPKSANQKLIEVERDKVINAYGGLQKLLAAAKIPETKLAAADFQSELKKTVDAVLEKAKSANIPLHIEGSAGANQDNGASKFDLGFDYLGQLPEGDAATPLGKELKVLEWLVNMMIDKRVAALPEIKREKLPEESGATKPAPAGKSSKKGKNDENLPDNGLIERSAFSIKFRAPQDIAGGILNAITGCKEQFLVIRKLKVANTAPQPPTKVQLAANPAPVPQDPAIGPAEGTNPTPPPTEPPLAPSAPTENENNSKLTFLIGRELVDVEAEIEILDFLDPSEASKTAK